MPRGGEVRRRELLSILDNNEDTIPSRFQRQEFRYQPRSESLPKSFKSSESKVTESENGETPEYGLTWLFPVIKTIQNYSSSLFFADIRAASSVAFVLIPQAIAFSTLAGVSPIRALVSAIFPLLFYALFGASKQLSVGPEALSSVLVGLCVAKEIEVFGGDPNELATTLGFLVGIFAIFLSMLQAGFIDNILSGYLLTGFVLGVASLIIIEQIPAMFGLHIPHSETPLSTFMSGYKALSALPESHVSSAMLGLGSLFFLIGFKFLKKRFHGKEWVSQIPEILLLVLITTSMSAALDFKSLGIATLGELNNKLPPIALPSVNVEQIGRLIPNLVIITVVGFIESQTVTRGFGLKNGYFPSGDRELFALGTSNALGSIFGAYVTFGSLPRSRILANSGGKTTLAGGMAAIIVLVMTTTAGTVLSYLAKPTLAAIVMNAAINLIEYDEIIYVFKMRNIQEILMFLATTSLTLFVSITNSILFCIGISALLILRKTTNVSISLLGKLYFTSSKSEGYIEKWKFADVQEYPDAELIPGVLAVSLKGNLEFYNASRLRRRIEILLSVVAESTSDKKSETSKRATIFFVDSSFNYEKRLHVILDFSKCEGMDSNATFILKKIIKGFKKQNVLISFTCVNPNLRKLMDRGHVTGFLGVENYYYAVEDAYSANPGR